jgi:cation/acetate symporter
MMLFWKRTTSKGMVASIVVGIVASVGIILFSPTAWELYGKVATDAPIPLKNPGIISIPLSFLAIYVVSKLTKPDMMEDKTLLPTSKSTPQAALAEPAAAE